MANIKIEFNTDNAAFEDAADTEIDFVMQQVGDIIKRGNFSKPLRDSNGNKIGTVIAE